MATRLKKKINQAVKILLPAVIYSDLINETLLIITNLREDRKAKVSQESQNKHMKLGVDYIPPC